MLECNKCGQYYFEEDFYMNKKTGQYGYTCKHCIKQKYRTIPKLIAVMYNSQLQRCKKYGFDIGYTRQEFYSWVLAQPTLVPLYNQWRDSGWSKDMRPSIDRLDDYATYSVDNIQLTTWKSNNEKGYRDRKSGTNSKVNHRIVLDGVFYPSIRAAMRELGLSHKIIKSIVNGNPVPKAYANITGMYVS